MLSIIAVILAVLQRRQIRMPAQREIRSAVPRDAAMAGLEAFEAAAAASRAARHARLARAERIRGILTPVVFCLCGSMVLFALAAFVAGDREAATVCAMLAAITCSFTTMAYLSARRAGQKAAESAAPVKRS